MLDIRGTNSFADAIADADPQGVGSKQFRANWHGPTGVKSWLDSMGNAFPAAIDGGVDIVGHSLGGALAQLVAAEYTHLGKRN